MQPKDLSVVVSGATHDVGAAVARELVRRGGRVLLVGRTAAPLVALARELSTHDDHRYRVDALAADVATARGCRAILDAATARSANALVNTPGAEQNHPAESADAVEVDAWSPKHIAAPARVTRALLPLFLQQPEARILNIGATSAPNATTANAVVLRAFSQALRRELAGSTVRPQFLGPRSTWAGRAVASRNERPEYVASIALQMLLAGTSERFLGLRGDLLGRLSVFLSPLLDQAPKHRRA